MGMNETPTAFSLTFSATTTITDGWRRDVNQQLADEEPFQASMRPSAFAPPEPFDLLRDYVHRRLAATGSSTRPPGCEDGATVSFDPDFDYSRSRAGARPLPISMHSSLHTSNKTPDESIGTRASVSAPYSL